MISLKEIKRGKFIYLKDKYEIGTLTDEIIEWLQDNAKEYQMYAITGKSIERDRILAEIIIYQDAEMFKI